MLSDYRTQTCVMLPDGTPDPDQRCPGCQAELGFYGIRNLGNESDPSHEVMFECGSYFMTDLDEPMLEESEACGDRWAGARQRLEAILGDLRRAIDTAEEPGAAQDLPGAAALEAFYNQLLAAERVVSPGFWPDSVRQSPEDVQPLEAMCCQNTSKACMFNGPCGMWASREKDAP